MTASTASLPVIAPSAAIGSSARVRTTGLLLVAAEESDHYDMHNYIALPSNGNSAPAITSFTPQSGPVGTQVTITRDGQDHLVDYCVDGDTLILDWPAEPDGTRVREVLFRYVH